MPQISDIVHRPHYRVDLYIDPMLDLLSCLAMLEEEAGSADPTGWKTEARNAMGEELQKEVRDLHRRFYRLRFLKDLCPYCALQEESGRSLSMGDLSRSLERFRRIDDSTFAKYMLGLEIESGEEYNEKILQHKEQAAARMEQLYGPVMTAEAVREILEEPARLRERCASVMERFWNVFFREEWERIRPRITQVAEREESRLILADIAALLSKDVERVTRVDSSTFIFDDQEDFPIDLDSLREVHLFLSAYLGQHLSYNILREELILAIYVPMQEETEVEAPEDFLRAAKALGDPQRLKILRHLWNREATTGQLAQLLALAESTVSVHLKILKEAELVQSTRRKKNVFYTADRKALAGLSHTLENYLQGS